MTVLERRMTWALAIAAIAAALLAGAGLFSTERASAESCANACRNAYNQCRIETKGSSGCESQFTQCMQSCRRN
jgi:hypothetical protein